MKTITALKLHLFAPAVGARDSVEKPWASASPASRRGAPRLVGSTRHSVAAVAFVLIIAATAKAGSFDTETKLTANDAAAGDQFGVSVAISGNIAIVGAPGADFTGSAYLFDVNTGSQLFKLTAADAAVGDAFGISVAISGNMAVVGAHRDDGLSGSVYVFDVNTGNQIRKVRARDAAAGDEFGLSVGISGNTAIVGAHRNDDGGFNSGSAYLFDVTTGNQLAKLTDTEGATGDAFGWSVGISGNMAIVGARADDVDGSNSGSAFLFGVTTGSQLAKLVASDASAHDNFGRSVGISGNTAIVGANGDDDDSGSAYLFDVTTSNELRKLTASDAESGDGFGWSVGISGNVAIAGARFDDHAGAESGAAYLFDVTTGSQLMKLTAVDAVAGDSFGYTVAVSGNMVIVGAFGNDDAGSNSGSAYLFTPEPSSLLLAGFACLALLARRRPRRSGFA